MKEISLSKGFVSLVDDFDYNRVSQFTWSVHFSPRTPKPYARGWVHGKIIYLHRFILDTPKEIRVDHRDGDGLNNTRENLRVASRTQNNYNAVKRTHYQGRKCSSNFKGVSRVDRMKSRPWRVCIFSKDVCVKRNHLGYFHTEEEAARAYDKWAYENYGVFAKLNFPK